MKNPLLYFGFACLFILGTTPATAQPLSGNHHEVKHVILMVPDGMGLADVTAARILRNCETPGEPFPHFCSEGPGGPPLNLETLEHIGYQRTYSKTNTITDSSAAASAFACGEKFVNNEVCFHEDGAPHNLSMLELAQSKGMATGLVATQTITHATPASFASHLSNRNCETEIARQYPGSASPALQVVAKGSLEEVTRWSTRLADLPGVASVDTPVALGGYVSVGVRPESTDPGGREASDVVRAVRGADAPFPVWVTGQAANQIDFVSALVDRAGWAVGIVSAATLVLLFLMTGSVLIPIKALLTNAISLTATVGVLVWSFQEGHLEGALGFESTGGIETYVLALVLAFAFGLAMDYEVFLLSRIKERHDAGADNDTAVREGLQRSGRIITSAAAIIIVVFVGFVLGKLLVIKEVGFSLAVAVLIDATLVRMLLVPATMTLLGRANWWAPGPLRRLHARFGLEH